MSILLYIDQGGGDVKDNDIHAPCMIFLPLISACDESDALIMLVIIAALLDNNGPLIGGSTGRGESREGTVGVDLEYLSIICVRVNADIFIVHAMQLTFVALPALMLPEKASDGFFIIPDRTTAVFAGAALFAIR
ncbi:hypothetical protein C1H76_2649 [Elsinoe australis]|uniref:Uncharacterized protein n=1 Tax=Elsinoe australis TaxID=40998 RepID=A0A4U7B1Q7_9PEZI|nr:hypothetical protein C1H76_2649 [Elsinoe australis]